MSSEKLRPSQRSALFVFVGCAALAVPALTLVEGCGLEEGGFGAGAVPGGAEGGLPDQTPGPGELRKIGGEVTGLVGRGLTLQNNGGDDLVVTEDGPFVFPTGVASGAAYSVKVKPGGQPTETYQRCTVAAGEGLAGDKNVLGIQVTCALLRSCKELHEEFPSLASASYLISPDGESEATAYCDMAYDGGGWTLIAATTNGSGPDDLTVASSKEEIAPGKRKYMSPDRMKALAAKSSQVHIRESAKPDQAITSTRDSEPIVNLRKGLLANSGMDKLPASEQTARWTGTYATDATLGFNCPVAEQAYPAIYWACGNATGMHLVRRLSVWQKEPGSEKPDKNIPMDIFLR